MKTKLAEFTTEQAAAILQKTPEQIQTLCRMGLLDAVKACGTWRIYDLQIQGEERPATKPRRHQPRRRATPPQNLTRLEVEAVEAERKDEPEDNVIADVAKLQKMRASVAHWKAVAAILLVVIIGLVTNTIKITYGSF